MKFLIYSESINIYKPTIYSIYSICIRISGYLIFLGFLYTEFFLSFYLKYNFKFIYFFIVFYFILLFFFKIFMGFYKNLNNNILKLKFIKFLNYISLQLVYILFLFVIILFLNSFITFNLN